MAAEDQIRALIMEEGARRGYKPEALHGFVGNLSAESSFNTGAVNPNDNRKSKVHPDSIGLGQWNDERAVALKDLAAKNGVDWRDKRTQVQHIFNELEGSEIRAGQMLRNASTIEDGAKAGISYERPKGFTWDNPTAGHNWSMRLAEGYRFAGLPAPSSSGNAFSDAPVTRKGVFDTSVGAPNFERDRAAQLDAKDLPAYKLQDSGSAEVKQIRDESVGGGLTPDGKGFQFSAPTADELRPKTGWWEGVGIGFQSNLAVQGFNHIVSPTFKPAEGYDPYAKEHTVYLKEKGITDPEMIGKMTGKSVSKPHLDFLVSQEMEDRSDAKKMNDFGFAGRLLVSAPGLLTDPTLLVPQFAAYKGLNALAAKYRAETMLTKLAEGALVNLVGVAPNIALKYATDDKYTGHEALIEGGMAVLLGAPLHLKYGALGHEVMDAARKQVVSSERALAQELGAAETEAGKAYFEKELAGAGRNPVTGAGPDGKTKGSVGAAANDEMAFEKIRQKSDLLDVSDIATVARTDAPEFYRVFTDFIPDPIKRTEGARSLDFSAWEIGNDIKERAGVEFHTHYQGAFEELLKRDKVPLLQRGKVYQEYGEQVTAYARKPVPGADPLVVRGAEAFRRADDMVAAEIEALKGTRDINGNLIPWIENFKKVDNHVNRIIDYDVAATMLAREGKGFMAEGFGKVMLASGEMATQLRDKAAKLASRDAKPIAKDAKAAAEVAHEQASNTVAGVRKQKAAAATGEADDYAWALKNHLDDIEAERALAKQHGDYLYSGSSAAAKRMRDTDMTLAKHEALLDAQVQAAKDAHAAALKEVRDAASIEKLAGKTADKIARKEVKEAGTDAFADAYARHFVLALDKQLPEVARLAGHRVASTIEQLVGIGRNVARVGGSAQELLVEATQRLGIPNGEVDKLIAAIFPAGKTGPGATRRRLPIDETHEVMVDVWSSLDGTFGKQLTQKPFKYSDLLDNDAASIMGKYTDGITQDIGLATKGYGSYGQYEKALIDAADAAPMQTNKGLFRSAKEVAINATRKAYGVGGKDGIEQLLGDTATRVLRGANAAATASFGGNFAVGAIFETANAIKRFGAAVIHENTGVKDIWNAVRKGGPEADNVYQDIQVAFGIGFNTKSQRTMTRLNGLGDHLDLDISRTDRASRIFESAAQNAAKGVTTGLGMVPITDMTKLATARTLFQTVHDLATGAALKGSGKLRHREALMNELGVDDTFLRDVKPFFERMPKDKEGLITGFKNELGDAIKADPAAWNTLRLMMRRADRSGIASASPGVVPWWADNLMGKTLLQFMTFSFLTHNYATLNDWNVGKHYAVTGLALTVGAGMMQHAAMTYFKSLAKPEGERQKYLDKQLGGVQAFVNGYARSPTSGLIPTIVDNASAPFLKIFGVDEAPFSGSRLSGIESRTIGISAPVTQLALGVGGLFDTIPDAVRSDKVVTQQQAKNVSSLFPARSFLPISMALEYGFSSLPKQEPVAQAWRNKNSTKSESRF